MGPFYCPADQKVYIDLSFYRELRDRFGAGGDFAQAYVIAHEVGHHVQNVLGIMDKVDRAHARMTRDQANALSVRVELQADYLAGVWAAVVQRDNAKLIEPGDFEQGLNAAGDRRRPSAAAVVGARRAGGLHARHERAASALAATRHVDRRRAPVRYLLGAIALSGRCLVARASVRIYKR